MSETLSVRLVDWDGNPVVRCPVTLWQGDVEVGRGVSDVNGVAVVHSPQVAAPALSKEVRVAIAVACDALYQVTDPTAGMANDRAVCENAAATLRSFLSVSTGGTWCCQSCGEEFSEDPGSGHTVAVDDGRGNPIPERCGPVSWKSVAVSTEGK